MQRLNAGDGGTIGGIAINATATGTSSIGVFGSSISPSGVGIGVQGDADIGVVGDGDQTGVVGNGSTSGARGVQGNAFGSGASCFYANASQGAATYSPFTGSHEGLLNSNEHTEIVDGDIVCDVSLFNTVGISDAITNMKISDSANDKSSRGVFLWRTSEFDKNKVASLSNLDDDTKLHGKDLISFNALGEGLINVCGEGGDIDIGDLITTSNIKGKGMKQKDDIIRNYTVAEARQKVTFSSKDEVKMIAVIYRCG